MHVVLVSACSSKALRRTRRILDSYARRSGEATWITPITEEGLAELRGALRRVASRNTAVACFRNDGRARMRLLWTVGRPAFDRGGASPVAREARRRATMPGWARATALLAAAAGYAHDVGKYGKAFQDKLLARQPVPDPVRHEWISLALLRKALEAKQSLAEAWQSLFGDANGGRRQWDNVAPFDGALQRADDALLALVATHHRLPHCQGNVLDARAHVRDASHVPEAVALPEPATERLLFDTVERLRAAAPAAAGPLYWRWQATFARMALILADHAVSAEPRFDAKARAYANTDRGSARLNQSLDWHIRAVGDAAGRRVHDLLTLRPPSLAPSTREALLAPSAGRFAWQNRAAAALEASAARHEAPHLVFNLASTGSGKTRMNARAICALARDKPVRFATALNLRTLTLQVADAYAHQLGIAADQMACVIGDRLTLALHAFEKANERSREPIADDDENPRLADYDVAGAFRYDAPPTWLEHFLARGPASLGSVVGAPALVSTVDFLVAAGEPQRQAHHALAAARLLTSDLILDEIDSYDGTALIAVLRLVMVAGQFGRNVVASSATLSRPVAEAVCEAYAHGAAMRAAVLNGDGASQGEAFSCVFIDDRVKPTVHTAGGASSFADAYRQHVERMLETPGSQRARIPSLARLDRKAGEAGLLAVVADAVVALHNDHAQRDPRTGRRVSFGLVRLANVRPAVLTARHLASQLAMSRVCCYHANHLALQRYHIERTLDALLTRKQGDAHLFAHPQVRGALDTAGTDDVIFIVVATPVEEIGRDHDFDWAVLEPSSTQSMVQAAGRVNRHRLHPVERRNVAILQFNWRAVTGDDARPVFVRPGLEAPGTHPSHDLAELIDWQALSVLDARLRFGDHPFAHYDDQALREALSLPMRRQFSAGRLGHLWMGQETYTSTPLRAQEGEEVELCPDPGRAGTYLAMFEGAAGKSTGRSLGGETRRHARDWLVLDDSEALALAHEMSVDPADALRVSLRLYPTAHEERYDLSRVRRDLSFGFWKSRSSDQP